MWMDHGMSSYDHILIQDKRCFDEGFFFLLILIITIKFFKKLTAIFSCGFVLVVEKKSIAVEKRSF